MMVVFRWCINRIYGQVPSASEASRYVEVAITPQARANRLKDLVSPMDPLAFFRTREDTLDRWEEDEEFTLEGWTTEGAIVRALSERNALGDKVLRATPSEERKLEEDMVFLQFAESDSPLSQRIERLRKDGGLPDVTMLTEDRAAGWLDYTQQARRMAEKLYRRLLGEETEAPHAGE
jgi:hypothetical protein